MLACICVYVYEGVYVCKCKGMFMCVCIYACINQMFDVKSDVWLFVCTNQMFGLIVVYSLVQSVYNLYFEYEINDK